MHAKQPDHRTCALFIGLQPVQAWCALLCAYWYTLCRPHITTLVARKGHVFGHHSLLTNEPRSKAATVVSDCTLLALEKQVPGWLNGWAGDPSGDPPPLAAGSWGAVRPPPAQLTGQAAPQAASQASEGTKQADHMCPPAPPLHCITLQEFLDVLGDHFHQQQAGIREFLARQVGCRVVVARLGKWWGAQTAEELKCSRPLTASVATGGWPPHPAHAVCFLHRWRSLLRRRS